MVQYTRAETRTVGARRIIYGVKVSECHFEDLDANPALLKTLDLCDALSPMSMLSQHKFIPRVFFTVEVFNLMPVHDMRKC